MSFCVALDVLELTLETRLALNSEIPLPLSPSKWMEIEKIIPSEETQTQKDKHVEGHLGCFQILAITNNAVMNIVEQISLLYECAFFGNMPKRGIAGS
ncbi:protein of unknown function DUF1725 containing protein [Cricetulus griseus]|uniref:Uncharacterized protein n=1 Tax=Cricetulus griseus TaxID=10029 RepID=A0A061I134_CRIGR|nr:protein of unknown function DUF1725 containing protein [Cricetulus griseus]